MRLKVQVRHGLLHHLREQVGPVERLIHLHTFPILNRYLWDGTNDFILDTTQWDLVLLAQNEGQPS